LSANTVRLRRYGRGESEEPLYFKYSAYAFVNFSDGCERNMSYSKNQGGGQNERPVSSPCVSVCALDNEDICTGCYRSADEIRLWGLMTNQEKRDTLTKAYDREKLVNPFL